MIAEKNFLCLPLQVHHDLAKYHEMGRFILPGSDEAVDLEAALFHEQQAAELGVKEAIITMANIYLQRPQDVLPSITVMVSIRTAVSLEKLPRWNVALCNFGFVWFPVAINIVARQKCWWMVQYVCKNRWHEFAWHIRISEEAKQENGWLINPRMKWELNCWR